MKVKQENQDLRDYARMRKVALWQIAAHLGIHEMTLIGRLRKPYDEASQHAFKVIVDSINFAGE